jgi:ATP-dependent Lon protease
MADTDPTPATAHIELPPLPADAVPIVALRNVVLFPGIVLPVTLGREESIAAAQEAVRTGRKVGLLLQRDATEEKPTPRDLYEVGVVATVVRYVTAPDGAHHLVCQGESRFRLLQVVRETPFLAARVDLLPEPEEKGADIEARMAFLKQRAVEALSLLPQVPAELTRTIRGIDSAGQLADLIVSFMDVKPEEKQDLLETLDLKERLDKVVKLLAHRVEVLKITRDITEQTQAALGERQREAVLREQLHQLQKELGEGEGGDGDIAELDKAIAAAHMPGEVEEHARKELKRLQRMSEASPEHGMVRTYLDLLVSLPWSKADVEDIDIERARRVLDEDHYGLEKVKRRILEYLAVRKLNPQGRSPILCFVGPPGVGKTSLGQSVARALGLKFVRASLGGVHDEAEIRGHRRTYVGALPGNIIQGLRKAGTRNPVFMLDEIDKLGASYQGDPASALLEVLDPEQNGTFRDNYLALPFDLRHARHHPGTVARPHGDHRAHGLHGGGEARDRQALSGQPPARGQRAEAVTGEHLRCGPLAPHPRIHPRVGLPQPRAADRRVAAPRRHAHRRGQGRECQVRGERCPRGSRTHALRERGRATDLGPRCGDGPCLDAGWR